MGQAHFKSVHILIGGNKHENALYHQDNFLPDDYPGILYISYPDHNIIGRVLTVTKSQSPQIETLEFPPNIHYLFMDHAYQNIVNISSLSCGSQRRPVMKNTLVTGTSRGMKHDWRHSG